MVKYLLGAILILILCLAISIKVVQSKSVEIDRLQEVNQKVLAENFNFKTTIEIYKQSLIEQELRAKESYAYVQQGKWERENAEDYMEWAIQPVPSVVSKRLHENLNRLRAN